MLLRKMLRDMKLNKTQFISIFLMAAMAIFIYAGVSAEWNGMKKNLEKFYSDTNYADALIYSSGFSEESVSKIKELPGVTGVERRLSLEGVADFDNQPSVILHFVEEYKISQFKLLEGEPFDIDKDGIWLDSLFAEAKGLKVGDEITLTLYGLTAAKTIKGLIMSPDYVYNVQGTDMIANHNNYGYGFLSHLSFPKDIPIFYTELLVTSDQTIEDDFEDLVDGALEGKYSLFFTREQMMSNNRTQNEIKEHKAMGQVFPIAFLAVAMLTMITTMARLVNNQRTQIGIFKAMGFKRRKILFHYVSYGLFISLFGAFLGIILGPIIIPGLFYRIMEDVFTLPEWKASIPISAFYMAAASVLVCTFISYLTCRYVLKETPSQALRPKAPIDIRHNIFDRMKLWRRLSFHTQWNIRDVFRCKGRSSMAIAGVMGCTALLCCAFGMQDSFKYLVSLSSKELIHYESKLLLKEEVTPEQVIDIKERVSGELILEDVVEIRANGKKRSGEMLVMDQVTLLKFVDAWQKPLELPKDQLSLSYHTAEYLGVSKGDQISWHHYGEEKWNTATVGAIYRTPFTQGITMSREYYEADGYSFKPTAIITADNTEEVMALEGDEDSYKLQTKEVLVEGYNDMLEAMQLLIYILIIAAVFLAVVVIYNLGILSFTERHRELSTLKVIGFKTGKLRKLLLSQNIWLTIVGIIFGIPFGLWMLRYVFRFAGQSIDFVIIVNAPSYLYTIFGTLLVSIVVNFLFSKKVSGIDMVSSLKGVE